MLLPLLMLMLQHQLTVLLPQRRSHWQLTVLGDLLLLLLLLLHLL
jgi:hypothetical protein